MPATSDQTTDSKTPDGETLELIYQLTQHAGWEKLAEYMQDRRQAFFANMARGLMGSKNPVDQREVDEKRGYWDAVDFIFRRLPRMNEAQWKKFVEKANAEAEANAAKDGE